MAGIGFELRRLTAQGHYTGLMHAYASAALLSAGPWIISILSLMLLTWLLHQVLPPDSVRFITASITHVYALALVLTGPVQLVLTRHTADCFSAKDRDSVFPSFIGALILTSVLSTAVGGWFFLTQVPAPPLYQAAAAALFVHVACIFVASTYLSALRQYNHIVLAFLIGYGAGVAAAYLLTPRFGVTGTMLGFLAGHCMLFVMLALAVYREFGRGRGSLFAFLRSFVRFPELMLCGLFYNLAMWIDKFLFWWFSQSSIQIAGRLHAAPDYDLAIYLSLLSIVPGMAVFFLQVETTFAERYHEFFDAVQNGGTFREIVAAKHAIVDSLRDGFSRLIKVQGLATTVLVVFADHLAGWFQIGFVQAGIFRITLFGALLLVVFLSTLTVLFYFDDRKGALLCSFVFLVANASLSVVTLLQNEAWYGFGFVVATALALFIAALRVNQRIEQLEYRTLCAQAG
jgi:uncharacterized membrane protein